MSKSKPRFSWRRDWFTDPRNVLSYGGWDVGRIERDGSGWRFVCGARDGAPEALAACVPTTTSASLYETPAQARAGLETFLRTCVRDIRTDAI